MRYPLLRLTPAALLALTQGGTHIALPCQERSLKQVGEAFYPLMGSVLVGRRVRPPSRTRREDTVRLQAAGHPRVAARVTNIRAVPAGQLPPEVPRTPSPSGLYWLIHLADITSMQQIPDLRRTLGREQRRSVRLQAQVKGALAAQREHQQRVQTVSSLLGALA